MEAVRETKRHFVFVGTSHTNAVRQADDIRRAVGASGTIIEVVHLRAPQFNPVSHGATDDDLLGSAVMDFIARLFVANHVLEHIPDIIFWMDQLRRISCDNAHVFLSLPDKRYTFEMNTVEDLPVVVIGAGPVGLAAAARAVSPVITDRLRGRLSVMRCSASGKVLVNWSDFVTCVQSKEEDKR